jgi:hypothetical protein
LTVRKAAAGSDRSYGATVNGATTYFLKVEKAPRWVRSWGATENGGTTYILKVTKKCDGEEGAQWVRSWIQPQREGRHTG